MNQELVILTPTIPKCWVRRYLRYQLSDHWRELRAAALARDEDQCKQCGRPAEQVHHQRYRFPFERGILEDVLSLCHTCHWQAHSQSKKRHPRRKPKPKPIFKPIYFTVTEMAERFGISKREVRLRVRKNQFLLPLRFSSHTWLWPIVEVRKYERQMRRRQKGSFR